MKSIEAIIPHPSVRPAIAQLHTLGVREITVEPVQVYRSDVHQTMIHRAARTSSIARPSPGCASTSTNKTPARPKIFWPTR